MKTRTITACVIFAMLFCMASGAFAAAPKLTVGSATVPAGETTTVNITASEAAGITGAAFTVTYDTTALDITVTSDFFGTFAAQGFDAADGLGTDGKVDGFDKPLVTNEVSGTGMRIAAANATAAASGANVVLFALEVKSLDENAAEGTPYDIGIIATELTNAAAGYTEPTEIDLLIEAKSDSSFASLLTATDAAANVTKGTIKIGGGNPGDLNDDKTVDIFDILAAVDAMAVYAENADLNDDDVVDIFDILAIVDLMGTNYN
jgi:hypothetical protein